MPPYFPGLFLVLGAAWTLAVSAGECPAGADDATCRASSLLATGSRVQKGRLASDDATRGAQAPAPLLLTVDCAAATPNVTAMLFNTLNGARDYVRSIPRPLTQSVVVNIVSAECSSPAQGAAILALDKPALDSGSPAFSITYQTDPSVASPARLTGGVTLRAAGWTLSADPLVPPGTWQYDLGPLGIDVGRFTTWGGIRICSPNRSELFYGGVPMTIARYPNINSLDAWHGPWMDWLWVNASQGQTLQVQPDANGKFAQWVALNASSPELFSDVWLHGFYHADWCDDWLQASNWTANGTVFSISYLKKPCGGSALPTARFRLVNLVTELDFPGEYYINKTTRTLYFLPPDGACFPNCGPLPILGSTYAPLIAITGNVSYVTFSRLEISFGRGHGIQVAATALAPAVGLRFLGLNVSNMGADGLNLAGVVNALVDGLSSTAAGCRPVSISGGNTSTLERSNSNVSNCNLQLYARWNRCYMPGISYGGVGMYIIKNSISNAPHQGIAGTGNDHLIRGNHLYNLVWGSSDAGAFYLYGSLVERGTVFDFNLVENVTLGEPRGVSATTRAWCAYLDGLQGGITVTNNTFRNCTAGLLMNGGRDNQVVGNRCEQYNVTGAATFDCIWYISFAADPTYQLWGTWNSTYVGKFPQQLLAVKYDQPPYSTRYPDLLNWPYPSTTATPSNCTISWNFCCRCHLMVNGVTNQTIVMSFNSTMQNNTLYSNQGKNCTEYVNPAPPA